MSQSGPNCIVPPCPRPLRFRLAASFLLMIVTFQPAFAQQLEWQSAVGGSDEDYLFTAAVTADDGYVLAGESYSSPSGNKASANHGDADFWLVKLDAAGNKQWDRAYGGIDFDAAYAMQRTSDGGYLLGGESYSGASGNKSSSGIGDADGWLVKTDANGNKEWEKVFGGEMYDGIVAVLTEGDVGCVLLGQSNSGVTGNKTSVNLGEGDYWLIKTDAGGNKEWERVFGGTEDDYPASLAATSDGGYILAGSSESGISGNKTNDVIGNYDYWIVKVDSNGIKQWERVYGGDGWDEVNAIQPTPDGGYVVAGSSESGASGNKATPNFGPWDWWVLKLDRNGDKEWEAVLGGADDVDYLNRVLPTPDAGYLLAGTSWSAASGNKTHENFGASDYWLVKLDANGNKLWEQSFGGTEEDYPWALELAGDGGYILAGHSASDLTGNKTSSTQGGLDGWILKLSAGTVAAPMLSIKRNPSDGVVISWPSSATGFSLQQNLQLGTPDWMMPAEAVTDDGTDKSITVTRPPGQRFYRLIKMP